MISIVILLIVETFAYHNSNSHAGRRSLKSYDSYEWRVASESVAEFSVSQFWWENYTTPALWSTPSSIITTTEPATAVPWWAITSGDDVATFESTGNTSLSPMTSVDSTAMFSTAPPGTKTTTSVSADLTKNKKTLLKKAFKDETLRSNIGFQGMSPDYNQQPTPPGFQEVPLSYNVRDPGVHEFSTVYESDPHGPSSQNLPSDTQRPLSRFQGYPRDIQRYPYSLQRNPGSDEVPPSSQGYPGFQEYPPASHSFQFSVMRYPPVTEELPPGSQGHSTGPQEYPLGFQEYPPASHSFQFSVMRYPPVTEELPPGSQGHSTGPPEYPLGFQEYPPASQKFQFDVMRYPPVNKGSQGPTGSQEYPPGSEEGPPVYVEQPPGSEVHVPPGARGYPGSEGYTGAQGLAPPSQGYLRGYQGLPSGYHELNPYAQRDSNNSRPHFVPGADGRGGFQGRFVQNEAVASTNEQNGRGHDSVIQNNQDTTSQHTLLGPQLTEAVTAGAPFPLTLLAEIPPGYMDMMDPPASEELLGIMTLSSTVTVIIPTTRRFPTSTVSLVETLNNEMTIRRDGYFSTFLRKLMELLMRSEKEKASELVLMSILVINQFKEKGFLDFMGEELQKFTMMFTQAVSSMATEELQIRAAYIYKMMSEPRAVLAKDTNYIINELDKIYQGKEGEELFHSLVGVSEYPQTNVTSEKVMQYVALVLLEPLDRLSNTEEVQKLLGVANAAIKERFRSRRRYLLNSITNISNLKGRSKASRTGIKVLEKELEYDGIYETFHREKYRRPKFPTAVSKKKGNKRKIVQLKSKGLDIETDRDFTVDKREHDTIDFKKYVKHKIKKHLKTKHHELYENYRNKRKQAKKIVAKQKKEPSRFKDGHYYENILRNKLWQDAIENTVITRKTTPSKYSQKRFNIVDKQNFKTIYEAIAAKSIDNKKQKTAEAKSDSGKSKYLTKYKPKIKTRNNSVNKTNRKFIVKDSSVSDEKDLKFNLQDTLRHGDRKFIERRNYETKNRQSIVELSSYSDEESVLKNNIYKVFGYTQGRI